jgi:ribosome-associated translation inhibitor RaiA
MKLVIQHQDIRATDHLDSIVEDQLLTVKSRLKIEEATVALSRRPVGSPTFHASILVVTPGPDLSVAAVDHTILAAFDKALKKLHVKLDIRDRNRAQNTRGNQPREVLGRRRFLKPIKIQSYRTN